MRITGMLLAMLLAGCSADARSAPGDRFAPGEWKVEVWGETSQGSTRGQPAAGKPHTVTLSETDARMPPANVLFTQFYQGVKNRDVRFENGIVEGSYEDPGMDDISARNVPVSGTYARDRFRLTFAYTVYGIEGRQIVEGHLVAPPR